MFDIGEKQRGPGRPSLKKSQLIKTLRQQIVSGKSPPGTVLPSRTKLMAAYGVSSITVQRTFDQLIADGFVETHGKAGTWVCEYPPHLHRYGLAFSSHPSDAMYWRKLDRALLSLVESTQETHAPGSLEKYFDTSQLTENAEVQRLVEDVEASRLAGVVLTSGETGLGVLLRQHFPKCPVVAITADLGSVSACVYIDHLSFFREALDCLRENGRQNIAILTGVHFPEQILHDVLRQEVPKRGMTVQPYWMQQVTLREPVTARGIMHLMMNKHQKERPNGLIIADDNITEYAIAGVAAAGATIPHDVEIVSHANFPLPSHSGFPIRRVGFEAKEMLQACKILIDAQRQGGTKLKLESIVIRAKREEHIPALSPRSR